MNREGSKYQLYIQIHIFLLLSGKACYIYIFIFIPKDTRSEFGCYLDRVILECPVGQTILVMSAYNGQYNYACDEGCCAPHPTDDCVESVEEYAPQV